MKQEKDKKITSGYLKFLINILQTWQNHLNSKNVYQERVFEYIYKETNQSYPKTETFSFHKICETETIKIIKSLPKNKATFFKDIPMRTIKDAASCLLSQTKNYLQQLYKKQ